MTKDTKQFIVYLSMFITYLIILFFKSNMSNINFIVNFIVICYLGYCLIKNCNNTKE